MPKQRRFEGPSLGPLLERVRDELGESAHIVEANRLRKGGMGGFFARETYEVVVETDDGALDGLDEVDTPVAVAERPSPAVADTTKPADDVGAKARSLLELAGEIAAENAARQAPATTPPAETTPMKATAPLVFGSDDGDLDDEPFVPAMPTVSTESASFAEILDRIAADVDSHAEVVVPPPAPAPVASVEPVSLPRTTAAEFVAARSASPTVSTPARVAARPTPEPSRSADTGSAAVTTPAPAVRERTTATTRTNTPTTTAVRAPAAGRASTPARATSAAVTRRLSDTRDRELEPYLRVGLPVHLAPLNAGEGDIRLALTERLRTLPTAPPFPATRGSLLAVVGNAESALRIARDLAEELGVPSDDIAFASEFATDEVPAWLHLSDPATAAERRRSWRRRGQLTLVAMDAAPGNLASTWARDVLDALEPSLAWGVVDAARKPEDVLAWTEHLGGLDSYAVEGIEQTVSPAAILKLPIPVARIDGEPATPDHWATILAGRLVA
ncbi:MAG: hypothetical protein U0V73_02965 [Acidimicrobiia bacterium]